MTLTAEQLKDKYRHPDGESWGEHPDWTMFGWQEAVGSGGRKYADTTLGYWEWVENQIAMSDD